MSTYVFRVSTMPLVQLHDDDCGHVTYELSFQRRAVARWGGVLEKNIAWSLKPWAQPVKLDFNAYRFANHPWNELEVGQGMWGCLLQGPKPGLFVAFALLDKGIPVLTKHDPKRFPKMK